MIISVETIGIATPTDWAWLVPYEFGLGFSNHSKGIE